MKMSVFRISRIGLFAALLVIVQTALRSVPGLEFVSFFIVQFAIAYPKDVKWICLVYVMIEGALWGFGLWWWTYLFLWPLFALLCARFVPIFQGKWVYWSIYLGAFGLLFGAFFAIPYLVIDPSYALTYWINGIYWDLAHCAGNAVLALALGKPVQKAFDAIQRTH